MISKKIYIPVEVKNREFNSRLLLASYAVENGFDVVIGDQRKLTMLLDSLPCGIYFDKSLSKNKLKRYEYLKSSEWVLASIDEEGLMSRNNKERYLTQRHSAKSLSLTDLIFTWGKEEKDIILEQYPEFSDKIFPTGNPRIDLLSAQYNSEYSAAANQLREKYGDYLLFPSSFSVNHALGHDGFFKNLENLGRITSDAEKQAYIKKHEFFARTFKKYVGLVDVVSKMYAHMTIIVRPHPSEDMSFWVEEFKDHDNVQVIRDGAITPWVMASNAVIHSSCTTGIEARALHKPVISYLPYTDHEYVKHISNELSVICHSEEDVLCALTDALNNHQSSLESSLGSDISYTLTNIDDASACIEIISRLNQRAVTSHGKPVLGFFERVVKKARLNLSELKNYKTRQYRKQKFDQATIDEIVAKVVSFDVVTSDLQASEIFDDVFWLRSVGKHSSV